MSAAERMNMDTPRVDALSAKGDAAFDLGIEDLARTLERELAEARADGKRATSNDLLMRASEALLRLVYCPELAHEINAFLQEQNDMTQNFLSIPVPADLHSDTKELVSGFAEAMAAKLHAAQQKYGYSNHWRTDDWENECRAALVEHVGKGDPLDVANYCAFMWARGWSTKP